jgi:hypothetical protein
MLYVLLRVITGTLIYKAISECNFIAKVLNL